MDTIAKLSRVLRGRRDGYWEFIATAIGDPASCERTMAGLSCDALTANFDGPAVSPTIVEQRIQALCAHDQRKLVPLSQTWKAISEISLDLMDPEADFWTTAWRASLRFLKKYGQVHAAPDARIPRPLAMEFAVLFAQNTEIPVSSWEEARGRLLSAGNDYDKIRVLDGAEVWFGSPIGEAELRELLGPSGLDQNRLERLRFFYGRTHLINETGCRYLETLLDEEWGACPEPECPLSGVAILLDLVLELRKKAEPPKVILDGLLTRLEKVGRHEALLPLVYLVVQQGWRCP